MINIEIWIHIYRSSMGSSESYSKYINYMSASVELNHRILIAWLFHSRHKPCDIIRDTDNVTLLGLFIKLYWTYGNSFHL